MSAIICFFVISICCLELVQYGPLRPIIASYILSKELTAFVKMMDFLVKFHTQTKNNLVKTYWIFAQRKYNFTHCLQILAQSWRFRSGTYPYVSIENVTYFEKHIITLLLACIQCWNYCFHSWQAWGAHFIKSDILSI